MDFAGEVERFPGPGGWYFVRIDPRDTDGLPAERGLIAVTASLGAQTWSTSLMPNGDGVFLALPAAVRNREGIDEGDLVAGSWELRTR